MTGESDRHRARRQQRRRVIESATAVLLAGLGLLLVILGVLAVRGTAHGAEPITCSYPPTLDAFQSVAPGSKWNAVDHNRLLCAINKLQARAQLTGALETTCTPVTVPAATRQLVSIGLAATVVGTEAVILTTIDPTNPARLVADGVQGVSGTTVTGWVFNHDATNQRTGTVCAQVRRP